MNNEDIIRSIIFLPKTYFEDGHKSRYDIIEESGYLSIHDQVTESDIRQAVEQCPEVIDLWLHYSQDKRTSLGFCFGNNVKDKYVVGTVHSAAGIGETIFSDAYEACAHYIKCEVDAMAGL